MQAARKDVSEKGRAIQVRVGAVSVPIYNYGDGRWAIVYRETKGGKRITVSCKTETQAREEAKAICLRIARGQIQADRLTADDRLQAATAKELLVPHGLTLDVAAREISTAMELTGGAGILEMARFWAQNHQAATSQRTPAQVLAEMMQAKGRQQLDAEYLRNVRQPLEKFAAAFPVPIGEISTKQIRDYLGDLDVQPRTLVNVRGHIILLFRFARAEGDLPDGRTTEAEKIGKFKVAKKPPKVYTAHQLRGWLELVRPEWLPWMALGAFAGIRTEEVERMDWSDLQWITKEIYIRPEVAKTGEGRYVPLLDNLAAWLAPHRQGTGRIFPDQGRPNLETSRMNHLLREAAAKAGRTPTLWDRNALRHSYGSHRLGIIQDLAKLTVEMGNSIAVNRANYQNPRSRQQCVEYFNLFPADTGKVVALSRG